MLLHRVRLRVVSEFAGHERTVRDLADALPDIPQATLYRHVAALVDGGVLGQVGEWAARGPSERVYRVAPGTDRVHPSEVDDVPPIEQRRMFAVFTASLIDSFAAYVGSGDAVPSADGLAYNRAVVNFLHGRADRRGGQPPATAGMMEMRAPSAISASRPPMNRTSSSPT